MFGRWLKAAPVGLCLVLLFLVGCSSGINKLSGKVTVGGQPLVSGFVVVHGEGMADLVGNITNGEYVVVVPCTAS